MMLRSTLEHERAAAKAIARCPQCGGRRKRIGFLPHDQNPGVRIDLYRCGSCDEKSDETVFASSARSLEV
jgi:hypothetical protein